MLPLDDPAEEVEEEDALEEDDDDGAREEDSPPLLRGTLLRKEAKLAAVLAARSFSRDMRCPKSRGSIPKRPEYIHAEGQDDKREEKKQVGKKKTHAEGQL